jgi:hypothetical protein
MQALNELKISQGQAASVRMRITALATAGIAGAAQLAVWVPQAMAETVYRAQGRCKLEQQYAIGDNFSRVFDGHCNIIQKEGNGQSVVTVNLDSGQTYSFWGNSAENLSIQTNNGIYPVRHAVTQTNSEVFAWGERGERLRLSVKPDAQQDLQGSHDKPATSVGVAIGAAILGGLIGGLITGKNKPSSSPTPVAANSQPAAGTNVARLSDLIGARAGQAELTVRQRGYRFVKSSGGGDSIYSQWLEGGSNNCVTIRTEQGRYQSIVYAGGPADCQK